MKFSAATLPFVLATVSAFSPSPALRQTSMGVITSSSSSLYGFDLSGNNWKPDSEKMGSTDTGDYFPDGYDSNSDPAFTSGMMGSQEMLSGGNRSGPQLPGLENLGADAVVQGGIDTATDIPAGMEFTPSSVPDGEYSFNVASSGPGAAFEIAVKPVCMTFEDYYAAFSSDSHPSLSVRPATGRMDRRGGEPSIMEVVCTPNGQGGTFKGDLVINLPEDNSKICYKISVESM